MGELKQEQWSRIERDLVALKEEKVLVISGKKKAIVRRETSGVSSMRVTIVHNKNRTRMLEHLLSHQWHEVEVCRGKEVSKGKSNPGIILRQPCRYYLKGTCTRSPCECWHLPERQFYKNESGCEAGNKCLYPHHKVHEQPNKKPTKERPFTKEKRKRRQKCSGYCENCISAGMCLARLRVIGFWNRQTRPEKPDAKSLGTDSKYTIHTVYATSSKYPGKERTIARKNTSQKSSSAKSLRCELWGPVPRRDWKTTAMRPKQGMEPCQKHVQAQRKRQGYILLARRRMGTSGCVNKRAGGKRLCGRCRSQYACAQQERP